MTRAVVLAGLLVVVAGCSKSPADALVGVWLDETTARDPRVGNLGMRLQFHADGRLEHWIVTEVSSRWTWKLVDGQTLELTSRGKVERLRYRIQADLLTIWWKEDEPMTYRHE